MSAPPPIAPGPDAAFVRRFLIGFAVLSLAALTFVLADLLLLVVGAIIIAAVIRAAAQAIRLVWPLPERWAVMVVVVLVVVLLGVAGWLFGPEIVGQISTLLSTLPAAATKLGEQIQATQWGAAVIANLEEAGVYAARFVSQVPVFALGVAGIIANCVLAIVGGIMLALEPAFYRDGFLLLFPRMIRDNVRRALDATGQSLKGWLLAQLTSMVVIGVLTGTGLALVGVPSAIGLGLFAGLAQFVPYVGPIVSAVPGLVIAAATGFDVFIWGAVVYGGVQQIDDNFVTPWVQQRIAGIPMALALFALVAFGILFGPVGVILATPLTLIALVMVRSLYIRDYLKEDVVLPGEVKVSTTLAPLSPQGGELR